MPPNKYSPYKAFAILAVLVIGLSALTNNLNPFAFPRFIGTFPPLPAMLLSAIVGFLLLSYLQSRGWFTIYKQKQLPGLLRAYGLTAVFASISILIDLKVVFSADMNIFFPVSLLFYPAIGFFVEILFHLLPLSILLFTLTYLFKNIAYEKLLWPCLIIVALLEPVYQMIFMEGYPGWATAAIGVNLFLFNLTQLTIFKKYDFLSMYSFRLIYYAIWHIVWGYFRLEILF